MKGQIVKTHRNKYSNRAKLCRELNRFYAIANYKELQKEYANNHDGVEFVGGFLVTWDERRDE